MTVGPAEVGVVSGGFAPETTGKRRRELQLTGGDSPSHPGIGRK